MRIEGPVAADDDIFLYFIFGRVLQRERERDTHFLNDLRLTSFYSLISI